MIAFCLHILVVKMNTNDFIQFQWKMAESEDDPLLITIDTNSSVVPDTSGGLTGIFNCRKYIHKQNSNKLLKSKE